MGTRAKYSGAVGTVIDGRLRDLQEHRSSNYPVCGAVRCHQPRCQLTNDHRSLLEMFPLLRSMRSRARVRFVSSEFRSNVC